MQQHEIKKFKCYNSFHECDNLVCVTEFIDDTVSIFLCTDWLGFSQYLRRENVILFVLLSHRFCIESIVSSLFWYDLCPFEVSIAHADPLLNENFSLKYYKATTFVESSLLGNCSLCFSGLFSSCKELSRTLEFLEKEIHFAFWRYLYFS